MSQKYTCPGLWVAITAPVAGLPHPGTSQTAPFGMTNFRSIPLPLVLALRFGLNFYRVGVIHFKLFSNLTREEQLETSYSPLSATGFAFHVQLEIDGHRVTWAGTT